MSRQVVTAVSSTGQPDQEGTAYRRYSEFEKLDRLLKSAFAGSHLLSSLPSLPGKVRVQGRPELECVVGWR